MFAMICSFILSRTLVPTMANYLLKPHVAHGARRQAAVAQSAGPLPARLRGALRALPRRLSRPAGDGAGAPRGVHHRLHGLRAGVVPLVPFLGRNFFPVGRFRPDPDACARARSAPGSRKPPTTSPTSRRRSARSSRRSEIATMVDNVGLPVSGINMTYNNTGTIGTAGRRHPDQADRGSRADRRLRARAAPPAARALPGLHLLLPAGRHHQPDPEFRRALADRRAGAQLRPRRRTSSTPTGCWPASARCRAWSTRASSSRAARRCSPSISTARARSMSG